MKKYTLLYVAFALLLIQVPAWSLGLGKTELHSDLGQSLMLEINVIGGEKLDDADMIFGIATVADYKRLNIDFNRMHNWLNFSIVRDEHNKPILLVTSEPPINEPFLHFIIEMKYPEGRLLKEVSVLLDTPK